MSLRNLPSSSTQRACFLLVSRKPAAQSQPWPMPKTLDQEKRISPLDVLVDVLALGSWILVLLMAWALLRPS
jgi:hypothetical protein